MVVPELILLALLVVGGAILTYAKQGVQSLMIGAGIFLAYSYGSKALLTQSHRQGLLLTKQGHFLDAIRAHKQSYAFFSKHLWLDRYRSLTLLTPALMSYREMALINVAYCYVQLHEEQQAKSCYERLLAEFPNNEYAAYVLKVIAAAEKAQSDSP